MNKLKDLPEGFPHAIAVSAAVCGYSENEVRQIFAEDNFFQQSTVDTWLSELRSKGWFADASHDDVESLATALDATGIISDANKTSNGVDGAEYLCSKLKSELTEDENGFKHRVAVLDSLLKQGTNDLSWISKCEAEEVIPFNDIADNYPFQGCKCVAYSDAVRI